MLGNELQNMLLVYSDYLENGVDNIDLHTEFLMNAVTQCLEDACVQLGTAGNSRQVIYVANSIWEELVNFAEETYHIQFSRSLFITVVVGIAIINKEAGRTMGDFEYAAIDVFNEVKDNIFMDMFDTSSCNITEQMINLEKELGQTDKPISTLIGSFFSELQKLGTFHRDVTEYETEEQLEHHKNLMAIYTKLISST